MGKTFQLVRAILHHISGGKVDEFMGELAAIRKQHEQREIRCKGLPANTPASELDLKDSDPALFEDISKCAARWALERGDGPVMVVTQRCTVAGMFKDLLERLGFRVYNRTVRDGGCGRGAIDLDSMRSC